jgi:hypothetical protein
MYYLLLSISTALIAGMGWLLWMKSRSLAFPLGMAMMYFWSIHGGWSIVTDRLGGDSGKHYHYLFDKLFPVHLDEHYAWTLSLYTLFALVVGMTALVCIAPRRSLPLLLGEGARQKLPLPLGEGRGEGIRLAHGPILFAAAVAGIASFWIMRDALGAAAHANASAYLMTRVHSEVTSWFGLHQVLNRVALVPTAIGLATLLSGRDARYLVASSSRAALLGYAGVLGGMFAFCFVLGNKNELFFATIAGSLFYLLNCRRPRFVMFSVCGLVLLSAVAFVDYVRGFGLGSIFDSVTLWDLASSLVRIASSNEGYGAHLSLYGVQYYDVPLTYGSSLLSLLASIVPRFIWPDRPEDIYAYYAAGVGAIEGQGYTVHHVTGWYLNFGIPGILIGGWIWGLVWARLYNFTQVARPARSVWGRVFAAIAFCTFTGGTQNLLRGGPEGYKGVMVDCFLIPVAILTIAALHAARSQSQCRVTLASIVGQCPHQRAA